MFTLLSWNIQQGGGSRVLRIIQKIITQNPSVVILSEFHNNNNSGFQIRSGLLKAGYRHQFVTNASAEENSVLIASRLICQSETHSNADPIYSQNILSVHFDPFSVMGVYLPHKKKHSLFPFIHSHIQNCDKPYIIAGDYNSGINRVDQEGDSFWYEDQMNYFASNGYSDAFRLQNGMVKEYSWYSHQGNGYRYDHTFIHDGLIPLVKNCYYLHDWRLDKSSDHSPMILTLG